MFRRQPFWRYTAAHDVEGLGAVLDRLLDDKGLRAALAGRARIEVAEEYSWPAVAERIVGVYRTLAGSAPATDWPDLDDLGAPVDHTCRFRAQPHLL